MSTNTPQFEVLKSDNPLEAISRAEIDMQISTAKKYPRTLSAVKAAMLDFATLDEETAASCFYTLPRGGKAIQGPSVRLAEIAISCFQNLRAGSRVIETVATGDNPHVIVQAVVHDLQNNVAISIEKRRRITKKKSKDAPDEDDINLACNACSSIALRDAVFRVVPQALIKPVYEKARKVAVGDIRSLEKKRGEVIERLKKMGAMEDRILSVVSCRKVDDIGAEHLEILIGLGTALKDGETTLEEAFPPVIKDEGKARSVDSFTAPKTEEPATPPAETVSEPVKEEQKPKTETASEPETNENGIKFDIIKRLRAKLGEVPEPKLLGAIVGNNPNLDPAHVLKLEDLDADTLDQVEESIEWYLSIAVKGRKK